jgi:hypothetical protein
VITGRLRLTGRVDPTGVADDPDHEVGSSLSILTLLTPSKKEPIELYKREGHPSHSSAYNAPHINYRLKSHNFRSKNCNFPTLTSTWAQTIHPTNPLLDVEHDCLNQYKS